MTGSSRGNSRVRATVARKLQNFAGRMDNGISHSARTRSHCQPTHHSQTTHNPRIDCSPIFVSDGGPQHGCAHFGNSRQYQVLEDGMTRLERALNDRLLTYYDPRVVDRLGINQRGSLSLAQRVRYLNSHLQGLHEDVTSGKNTDSSSVKGDGTTAITQRELALSYGVNRSAKLRSGQRENVLDEVSDLYKSWDLAPYIEFGPDLTTDQGVQAAMSDLHRRVLEVTDTILSNQGMARTAASHRFLPPQPSHQPTGTASTFGGKALRLAVATAAGAIALSLMGIGPSTSTYLHAASTCFNTATSVGSNVTSGLSSLARL